MTLGKFLTKFVRTIYGRIDFASQLALHIGCYVQQVGKGQLITNDHEIHITRRGFLSAGHRTKYEGNIDAWSKASECVPQYVRKAKSLLDDSSQFCEDRTLLIGPKIDLAAIFHAKENLGVREPFKLSLHSARTETEPTNDVCL